MVVSGPVRSGNRKHLKEAVDEAGATKQRKLSADAAGTRKQLKLSGVEAAEGSKSVRTAARIAALETELRILDAAASADTGSEVKRHGAVESPQLRLTTIIRGKQDARFRLDHDELLEALEQFGGDLGPEKSAVRTLVVVAHPDDESVGAGAQLARLRDVTVLHVTDGAPRAPGYAERMGFASADDYREFRRREVRDALALVGIPEERQLCLGIPDGEAPFHLVELALSLAELFDEMAPEVVLTHPYEGGHTDHDAVAFAVHLACGVLRREGAAVPAVLELTSYHYRNGGRVVHDFLPHPEAAELLRTVKLSRDATELKERVYERFVTQRRCLEQFRTDLEKFRPAPRYNFTAPPHDGTLDYELRSKRMSGEEWRSMAGRALDRLRTRRGRRWVGTGSATAGLTWSSARTTLVTPAALTT
jgi:N-acetylglucosamine malate deacetylase 2